MIEVQGIAGRLRSGSFNRELLAAESACSPEKRADRVREVGSATAGARV